MRRNHVAFEIMNEYGMTDEEEQFDTLESYMQELDVYDEEFDEFEFDLWMVSGKADKMLGKQIVERIVRNVELAEAIVSRIRDASAPVKCSWGDEYPDAHSDLFITYYDDMVADVLFVMRKHAVSS